MTHCHQRACSAKPHKTTKRVPDAAGLLHTVHLTGSACDCSCAECGEESVATGIRAPSPKEETIMDDEKSETTEEAQNDQSGAGWDEAAAASAEASLKEPQVTEAGTAELELPCLLTDEEKLVLGQRLADEHERIDTEEEEAKESAARHREKLKGMYEAASSVAKILRAGKEDRRVGCKIVHILELNQCRTVRLDTGEIVSERPLDYSERQGKLKLDVPPADVDPADASLDGDEPVRDEEPGTVSCSLCEAQVETSEASFDDEEKVWICLGCNPDGKRADAAIDGTDIDNPAALAGDEPAPVAKKAKRGKR